MENSLSPAVQKQALKSLQDEADGSAIYHFMAKRQQKKHPDNAKILEQMSKDEAKHYQMWAQLTGKTKRPHIFWKKILTVIMISARSARDLKLVKKRRVIMRWISR